MRRLVASALFLACACACGANLQARTAKMIGCSTEQTEITREWSQPATNEKDSWDAWCHGRSTFNGPGSPDKTDRLFACTKTKDAETCVEVYPR